MLNLACHLRDAFLNTFDVSVIVTNDTDLRMLIKKAAPVIGRYAGTGAAVGEKNIRILSLLPPGH
jgi:hypothetical protein